uniref:KIF-binding protein n=1 Tax=Cyclophora tenuis TaxID=216820 RepID=A0A7S1DC26_CYCTE|mmetsp:Transcript_8674/g.14656  ORF Transcript_8674/g.14656 Transcript_8674/m.14656 type:complete len:144 (+) Transcript_8674:51-482(+)
MTATTKATRPSDSRRAALRKADDATVGGIPLVSNMFSIDRYFEAAEKLLNCFNVAYKERRLDDAYVYGRRFAKFSLDSLPSHQHYRAERHWLQKTKNNQDMADVVVKLETVVQWMDQEELQKEEEELRIGDGGLETRLVQTSD